MPKTYAIPPTLLLHLIKKRGIRHDELAKQIGCCKASIYAWSIGYRAPQRRHAVLLEAIFEPYTTAQLLTPTTR